MSGNSTPPCMPLTTVFSFVRSISSPRTAVSSITPGFAAGMTPRAVSPNIKVSHGAASPSEAEGPCRTPISDATPDTTKPKCLVLPPHDLRLVKYL